MDSHRKDELDYAPLSYLDLRERGERARRNAAESIRRLHLTYARLEESCGRTVAHASSTVPNRTDGDSNPR